VGRFEKSAARPVAEVWIELWPISGRPMRCSACGRAVEPVHDQEERWVRDLPILDAQANRALMTVYVLKDELKALWAYRYAGAAARFWKAWHGRAVRSHIEPLRKFAKRLRGYLPGILAHCRWPLHTSLLEGINNKIKVLKRMAYGFRDDAYFFLKIRAAFPGNTG
jgi:hypothetical protein